MRSGMIAFAAGAMLVSRLPFLPGMPSWLLWGLLAVMGALLAIGRLRLADSACGDWPVWIVTMLPVGVIWAVLQGQAWMDARLPAALEGRDIWVWGAVDSLPRHSGRSRQFEFRVSHHCYRLLPGACREQGRRPVSQRLLLSDYSELRPLPGQRWRLRVRLNRPRGLANPGGTDRRAAMLQRGLHARGYVRGSTLNSLLEDGGGGFERFRWGLRERLMALPDDAGVRGLGLALMTGDRSRISDGQWQRFSATGTNHLIVISGLHVGLVAALAWGLGSGLARLWPALMLRVPAPRLAAMAAIVGAVGYAMLAGLSLPTQRALVMISVFMTARAAGHRMPPFLGLALSLAVVVALDPLAGTRAGFWLSFACVAALLFVLGGLSPVSNGSGPDSLTWPERLAGAWRRWGQAQWVAFVALWVPLALWMQQLSLVAPAANLLAIPLVSLLLVPLALLLAVALPLHEGVSTVLWTVLEAGLVWLQNWLDWVVAVAPASVLPVPGAGAAALICAAVASALLLAPPGWPARYLAVVLLVPLLRPEVEQLPVGQARVTMLDVGQGQAVVVRTASHTLVYDAGPATPGGFNAGRVVVLPYLRNQGLRGIDALVVSHGHADHSGGAAVLAEQLAPERLLGAVDGAEPCRAGQHWHWDGVRFAMLHPASGTDAGGEGNDDSCVLSVTAGDHRLLLTGDIEDRGEQALLRQHGDRLAAEVLQIPHHGSASSSRAAFVAAVDPDVALYSAGHDNRFGHPDGDIVRRYRRQGATVLGTDRGGALTLVLGGDATALQPSQYRHERRRYWHR